MERGRVRANAGSSYRGSIFRRRRSDNGRRDWTEAEVQGRKSESGPVTARDIRSVEGLRAAVSGQAQERSTSEILIIAGAILLAITTIVTLIITAQINARANRLIENDAIRAREGAKVVGRLEAKLDGGISVVEDNNRKIDELRAALATTTTTPIPAPGPTIYRRVPSPTPPQTVPPAPPRTTPPTTYPPPVAAVVAPCTLLIIVICIRL